MKRLFLLLLCITLTPCIAQQDKIYNPPPNVGDYWIYKADSLQGELNPYTTIEMYEAKDIINESDYFRYKVLSSYDSDGSVIVSFYSWVEPGILIAIGENSDVDSATILDPPIVIVPDTNAIGGTWEIEVPGSGQKRIYTIVSYSETVEVPAGNFENCMKVLVTVKDESEGTLYTEDYYYAEDIGKILMVSDIMGRSELTEYSVGSAVSYDTLYVGPGETYPHINNAVGAAVDGDLIIVKDGSYAGDIMVDKSVVIQSENGFDNVFIDGVMGLSTNNISVIGLTFSEWDGPGIAILNNSSGHYIEENFFHARNTSIDIDEESSSSSYIMIRGNTIEADSGDGISLHGNFHTIEENTIRNCRESGISIDETTTEGVTILHNYIADNGTNAITTAGTVEIIDNIISGNNWAQIFVEMTVIDPVIIKYNHINNGITIGIASRGPVLIEDNEIKDNGGDGILMTDHETSNGIIINNDIINNGRDGVQVRSSAEIENNLITGSGERGINIRQSSFGTVTIVDNEIRNNHFEGIKTSASAYIAYNFVEENEGSAIWINWDAEDVYMHNNFIINNLSNGVMIFSDAKLRENKISDNKLSGIIIFDSEPDLGQESEDEAGNNIIMNHGGYNIENHFASSINAYNNYWGTTDSTEIDNLIFDNDEADTLGAVNFMPCLLEEPATPVEEEITTNLIPKTTRLLPAYPNPFNPSTTIEYSISAISELAYSPPTGQVDELVSLIIYDVLGRQVTTLVNETQRPGQYSVQFNAAGLPSGVYYYRLISGQYSETKKLLLLK